MPPTVRPRELPRDLAALVVRLDALVRLVALTLSVCAGLAISLVLLLAHQQGWWTALSERFALAWTVLGLAPLAAAAGCFRVIERLCAAWIEAYAREHIQPQEPN